MGMIDFLLTQRCVITPFAGTENGEPVYGRPEKPRACRLQLDRTLKSQGAVGGDSVYGRYDTIVAAGKLFTTGKIIEPRSLVTVEGETYTVTACKPACGFGLDHLEVTLA